MNLDGSDKKQITTSYGYDGGAVFSRDGKKIAWRAGHPSTPETKQKYADLLKENLTSPFKMELFVADANGKNIKQITDFGCALFAPTFTPDGKQILFSSNKNDCDGRKFDLFLINIDGTGLKQVTNLGMGSHRSPSSLPMARNWYSSPTGKRRPAMSSTSLRPIGSSSMVRRRLLAPLAIASALLLGAPLKTNISWDEAKPVIDAFPQTCPPS